MSDSKSQIPDFLFQIALGFYDTGLSFATDPFRDKDIKGLQRLAPAALNLAFTAELLLKGLLLITSKRTIRGHNLNKLFNELNPQIKESIEERYNNHLVSDKDDKSIGSFTISIYKAEKKNPPIRTADDSLSAFLKVHSETFKIWRYLYDIGKDGYVLEINFKCMHCFIKALIETVNETPWKQKFHSITQK